MEWMGVGIGWRKRMGMGMGMGMVRSRLPCPLLSLALYESTPESEASKIVSMFLPTAIARWQR